MQDYVVHGHHPFMPPPPPPQPRRPPSVQIAEEHTSAVTPQPSSPPSTQSPFTTPRNPFGVYKKYTYLDPEYIDPEGFIDGADLVEDNIAAVAAQSSEGVNLSLLDSLLPSACALRLAKWYWDEGSDKSIQSFQSLIDIISSEDFQAADIKNTNWRKVYSVLGLRVEENTAPDGSEKDDFGSWFTETSWKKQNVPIDIPFDAATAVPGSHRYWIEDFYYRPLVDVIREKLSSLETQERFHLLPYELRWQSTANSPDARLHGEIYTSPAFAQAHEDLQVCTDSLHVFPFADESPPSEFSPRA